MNENIQIRFIQDSDGEEKKKSSSSTTAPITTIPTPQPVLVDAPESDEGETKDSDGGTPSASAPAAPIFESTTGTKAKKSKKSKKKRKKKTTSTHSSVRIIF